MKKIIIIITLAISGIAVADGVFAQDRPPREFTPRDGIVSLDRTLTFDIALNILQDYSQRFENKTLINRTGFNEQIGISIPGLYWHDALTMIVNTHRLAMREYPDRIEIIWPVSDDGIDIVPEQEREIKRPARQIYSDTREIEISAIFFEGNRRFLREIGVDWSAISMGRVNVTNLGAATVSEPIFSVDANISEMIDTGEWQIDALLNTLEANDKGEILSSPKIKVLEGEMGRIQVGQDFSIKQRDFAGNVVDQFFSTGTILSVTPWLIQSDGKEFVYMEIEAERSSAVPGTISTLINKQEASTRILLLDGETTAIAGLYETEENVVRRGIPILKDLPPWFLGLRYLFGYESREVVHKELVIVITAKLVPAIPDRSVRGPENARDFIDRKLEEYRQSLQRELDP